ncbi:hypothetical protein H9Y04_35240 [Streptomyces sp. TRM66268-LWL]|uniref:Uncharacterized protein n=1 Tax=Streptomyces polyasparticus TaxID=2767826 RepID=A0ABR7SQX2_9ACTN|nr:hypothetical protein [Streptomyces polyasparticus]MBC9717799.1 hypothetical protein [Streptomyces polyasparticus]
MKLEERLPAVFTAARQNVKATLDLIYIHAEQEVRGLQPRATLNPLIALTAVAAWERLLSDLVGAAKFSEEKWDRTGPGHYHLDTIEVPNPQPNKPDATQRISLPFEPVHLDAKLRQYGVLNGKVSDGWEISIARSWIGVTPKDWIFTKYIDDRGLVYSHLKTNQKVRNGVAHLALPGNGARAEKAGYGWYNDAKSKTIQNGHARGIAAFFMQFIDCTITTVARSHGVDEKRHRLPAGWFQATVPESDSRFPGAVFWGGHSLHRVS